jgi:hypothetical protein
VGFPRVSRRNAASGCSRAFYIGGGRQSLVGAKAEPSNSINLSRFFLNRLVAISTLCLPAGGAFFFLLAQRKETKEKAALALRLPRSPRRGTGGAITRCAQTVCPFIRFPTSPLGSAPTAPHRARIPLNKTSRRPTGRPSVAPGSSNGAIHFSFPCAA